tara:strand:+ start:504 stop:680 length:177 start_codon:yes stop_codon:yes gene_type:complete
MDNINFITDWRSRLFIFVYSFVRLMDAIIGIVSLGFIDAEFKDIIIFSKFAEWSDRRE